MRGNIKTADVFKCKKTGENPIFNFVFAYFDTNQKITAETSKTIKNFKDFNRRGQDFQCVFGKLLVIFSALS